MTMFYGLRLVFVKIWALFFLLAACAVASGAPNVQQLSGQVEHKGSVTLSGTGFGSKSTAAPLVWDDASGTSLMDKWDGAWPNTNAAYNTAYRAPQRGIGLPHNRVSRYIAGAHAQSAGSNAGYNVVFWKDVPKPTAIYASWYQRADDAWVFGGDNNFKTFAYSVCCSPYEMPNNWYTAYGPPSPGSRTDTPGWVFNDDGSSLLNPDVNGHGVWWDQAVNPMAGQWSKVEMAVKVSSQNDGYIKLWENGKLRINYLGPTDRYAGSSRSIGIGGYARIYGQPSNWRYFADVYLDTSFSRVVLANHQDLSQATVIEPQIPTAWSDSSIRLTVNLGKFSSGQTAYIFVMDASGVRNSTGLPVVIGGTALTPNPPTAVSAQ